MAGIWARLAEVQDLSSATSADLLDAMSTGRVVHVAAHGVHRGENPDVLLAVDDRRTTLRL